ncbi:hypothetical protein AM1_G0053 (plasmid) [Acaryochloris marina MBIC11017]|uniref:Uncharacterized protein n=1 Tax=Acaryochloris marina (strain MBIC 11017) TaxID=329726 RepID=A8ZQE7_ACAM1|nr:hypothetical protein AM1_G0053 [Acaryochloris marina MBIC11017]
MVGKVQLQNSCSKKSAALELEHTPWVTNACLPKLLLDPAISKKYLVFSWSPGYFSSRDSFFLGHRHLLGKNTKILSEPYYASALNTQRL